MFHLDRAFRKPGWVAARPDAFGAEVARIAALPARAINGSDTSTPGPRLARAEVVVFLDLQPRATLPRLLRRVLVGAAPGRMQAPGCRERLDLAFLRHAPGWRRARRGKDLALLERFGGTVPVAGGDEAAGRVAGWLPERHGKGA